MKSREKLVKFVEIYYNIIVENWVKLSGQGLATTDGLMNQPALQEFRVDS